MKKRVVVTALGPVTPIGIGKDVFWNSLLKGRSGVGPVTRFDTDEFSTKIAAEIKDFDPLNYMEKREIKKTDRFTHYAVAASRIAVNDSMLNMEKVDKERIGVAIGSGVGGIETIENQMRILLQKGPRRVSPFFVPMLIANMASGYVSIIFGVRGPNITSVTACATSSHSIGEAFRIIQRDEADLMIAGGAEACITPLAFAGFCSARAMSVQNDSPSKASRPFDHKRDGFVMGEGGGVVILESLDHAVKRGAYIYGEIVGYGMSGDAYHVTAPDPDGRGAYLCMKRVLKDASLEPSDIDYINAHGTSTEYNDKIETIAIKNLFGEHAYKLAISSTKSMTGHILGAAGGVEAIASLLALGHNKIPPTINYESPDPECDLDYVPNKVREKKLNIIMSNSFGFGGTNASLIFKRYL